MGVVKVAQAFRLRVKLRRTAEALAEAVRPALALLACLLFARPAIAQTAPEDPFTTARFRFGPLAVTPTIALTNVGVDTNVFNQEENPKRDFTAAFTPQVEAWLRLGRARLSGRSANELVWFKRYATERSVNTNNEVRVQLPLNRVRPYVAVTFLNSRQRPGYEIDARARRIEDSLAIGSQVRVLGKTMLDVSASRGHVSFDADAVFLGTSLREVLNRDFDRLSTALRYSLTPLTTIVLLAEAQRDRFEFSPVRDADSVRVTPGLELGRRALISGRAYLGYRKFDALGPGVPSYRGATASVDVAYTLKGVTQFAVRAERDVNYSFEISEPYYLLTGFSGSVTQRITGAWDVQGTGGRQSLDYRRIGRVDAGRARIDRTLSYGGGLGYRFGRGARLGVNLDYYRRRSDVARREYKGLRAGSSVTYGF